MKYQNNANKVSIRDIQIEDATVLMEMNNNEQISQFVVGSPRKVTFAEQLKWMERIDNEKNIKRFMVDCENQPVGTIIISDISTDNRTANMNIKLLPTSWGKGIGSSSINLALDYCFQEMQLECVTAHVLSFNKASLALFTTTGFVKEGILRSRVLKENERCDLVSFSILKNEYEEKRMEK